jgi:uncharacterized protein
MGKTIVLGASNNPERFSWLAVRLMQRKGIDFVPVGIKRGEVGGKEILDIRDMPEIEDVDTITIYMNPGRQKEYYSYILSLNPQRIIFNPGTENSDLKDLAKQAGINIVEACTIVMLESGIY